MSGATGQVGIGTYNFATGYKLNVDGKIACEELKVELSEDWPDYVFEEDYELMPLDELEAICFLHNKVFKVMGLDMQSCRWTGRANAHITIAFQCKAIESTCIWIWEAIC